jgi:probable biosynthetic protein (TIGR04098 family)
MQSITKVAAGMKHLDVHTLSEDWALTAAQDAAWGLLAESLGVKPSQWRDRAGNRMYAAVVALSTWFDLDDVVGEDDLLSIETNLVAIRKPHARTETVFLVDGKVKALVWLLFSFVKRDEAGSNKKFSKVRDVWLAEDFNASEVDDVLARHNAAKSEHISSEIALTYQVNQIQDFNAAGLFYFKNFVRIAKASEWHANRNAPTRLNSERQCYYFGNLEDGMLVEARVCRQGDETRSFLHDAEGRLLFLSQARTPQVKLAMR